MSAVSKIFFYLLLKEKKKFIYWFIRLCTAALYSLNTECFTDMLKMGFLTCSLSSKRSIKYREKRPGKWIIASFQSNWTSDSQINTPSWCGCCWVVVNPISSSVQLSLPDWNKCFWVKAQQDARSHSRAPWGPPEAKAEVLHRLHRSRTSQELDSVSHAVLPCSDVWHYFPAGLRELSCSWENNFRTPPIVIMQGPAVNHPGSRIWPWSVRFLCTAQKSI